MARAEVSYVHSDHLGSTAVVSHSTGAVQQIEHYNPFGEILRGEERGEGATAHLYTNQELDPESALYNYGARYYDSALARFTAPDPVLSEPPYAYVANNPVSYTDPTGELLWDVVDVAVFVINYKAYQDDPTTWNAFWLVVSGVGLLPVLPSGGYFNPNATAETLEATMAVGNTMVQALRVGAKGETATDLVASSADSAAMIGNSSMSSTGDGKKRGEVISLDKARMTRAVRQAQMGSARAMKVKSSFTDWSDRIAQMSRLQESKELRLLYNASQNRGLMEKITENANYFRAFMEREPITELTPLQLPDAISDAIEGSQLRILDTMKKKQVPSAEIGRFLNQLGTLF
ncbi:MAG: RHS repeat-associated core domain-containing protein [Deltaproteobacteria bacterium]|nr:RHS repeat-associated core domain-containing protein [Deltaproteobacteria bacterium]